MTGSAKKPPSMVPALVTLPRNVPSSMVSWFATAPANVPPVMVARLYSGSKSESQLLTGPSNVPPAIMPPYWLETEPVDANVPPEIVPPFDSTALPNVPLRISPKL